MQERGGRALCLHSLQPAAESGAEMEAVQLFQTDCLQSMRGIPDGAVDMILCDLPYRTGKRRWDSVIPLEPLWEQYRRVMRQDGAIVLFGTEPFSSALRGSNPKEFRYDWIWEREQGTNFMSCRFQPFKVHEIISVFSKQTCRYFPQLTEGTLYPRSVLTCRADGHFRADGALTQTPVGLLEYLIRTYTLPGETVLDSCMGSGSTGVACVNTGRSFIGMEIDPDFYQFACLRIREAEKHMAADSL